MASRALWSEVDLHGSDLEELLVQSGRGDTAAFAQLYDHLAPRVFGLVTSLVPDAATSEAVTCEAFVQAWHRSSTYDPERCSATAWVVVVAHRLAVRARRGEPWSDSPR